MNKNKILLLPQIFFCLLTKKKCVDRDWMACQSWLYFPKPSCKLSFRGVSHSTVSYCRVQQMARLRNVTPRDQFLTSQAYVEKFTLARWLIYTLQAFPQSINQSNNFISEYTVIKIAI